MRTMAAVRTLSGHTDYVFAVALSPDGNLVASGAWNGEVRVWKTADGTSRSRRSTPGRACRNAARSLTAATTGDMH